MCPFAEAQRNKIDKLMVGTCQDVTLKSRSAVPKAFLGANGGLFGAQGVRIRPAAGTPMGNQVDICLERGQKRPFLGGILQRGGFPGAGAEARSETLYWKAFPLCMEGAYTLYLGGWACTRR